MSKFLLENYGFTGEPYEIVGWGSKRDAVDRYEFIESIVQSGESILDIGCGLGGLYECLPEDVEYHGMDMSRKFLGMAGSSYPGLKNKLYHKNILEGGIGKVFDVGALLGVSSDLGTDRSKWHDLDMLVSNVTPMIKRTYVMDFWDQNVLKKKNLHDGMTPAQTWDVGKVANYFAKTGCKFDMMRPFVKNDFCIVVHC